MSLLDDLKKQAEAKKEQEQALEERRAQAAKAFRAEVRPRLAQAATYLSELAEHLNFVQPDIRADYPVKNYGVLEDLRQSNYRASVDEGDDLKSVTLTFTCTGDKPLQFDVQGEALMQREMEFLRDNRLTYSRREHQGERRNITGASFKVEASVPVAIRLERSADMRSLILTVSNLETLETHRYPLDYQRLTSEFLDELGKAVLRQESSFLRLDISPEDRKKLRSHLGEKGDQTTRKTRHLWASLHSAAIDREPAKAEPEKPAKAPADSNAEKTTPDTKHAWTPVRRLASMRAAHRKRAPPNATRSPKGPPGVAVKFARVPTPDRSHNRPQASVGRSSSDKELEQQLTRMADLQRSPMQLLDAAVWYLDALNHIVLPEPGRRLHYTEAILQHAHGPLARFHGEFRRSAGGLPEDNYRREALSRCVNVAAGLVSGYAQALQDDYPDDPAEYQKVRARIVLCAFRILELSRIEQRLRALRYQRMPEDAWRDCNRAFFLLAAHDETEQILPLGCDVGLKPRGGGARREHVSASPLDLYLSFQLFGFLELTMWPVQLFGLPDAYLDETRAKVRLLEDDGQALPPGRLLASLNDTGPARATRPAKVDPPSIELDYSELFTLALHDRMELDKMSFIAHFDHSGLSHTITEVAELDRLAGLDLLLHSLTRRERTHPRRAVLDDQRLHVHFGFNEGYRVLKRVGAPDTHTAGTWNLINFSTGGLLVGTGRTDVPPNVPQPARIGDLVVFAPVDKAHLPLIGYVARLQHPSDFEAQVAVVRLSRYAEAASVQSGDAGRLFEQPVILVQDVKNQWRVAMPPEYGFVSGSPVKLARADGRTIPARLGDMRLTRPEFVVFDIRSPGLETTPVDASPPAQ